MAMNHHFSPDITQSIWWAQPDSSQLHHTGHPPSAEAVAANEEGFGMAEKEYMFEKSLTPSDVGKLNRLVIPKQHAEKYFPLAGGSTSNPGVDSGFLLSFEDESGKSWKFRYSYWNSSQSYVLTKGWSRYVKEKGLDAGDVVFFGRLRADVRRKFIGYRHRIAAAAAQPQAVATAAGGNVNGDVLGWSRGVCYPAHSPSYPAPSTPPYQPHFAGAVEQSQTTPSSRNSKTLRLFGVNLEYQPKSSENNVPESLSHCDPSLLSQSEAYFQQYPAKSNCISYPQNYMEYDWSGDANKMRYHQG